MNETDCDNPSHRFVLESLHRTAKMRQDNALEYCKRSPSEANGYAYEYHLGQANALGMALQTLDDIEANRPLSVPLYTY